MDNNNYFGTDPNPENENQPNNGPEKVETNEVIPTGPRLDISEEKTTEVQREEPPKTNQNNNYYNTGNNMNQKSSYYNQGANQSYYNTGNTQENYKRDEDNNVLSMGEWLLTLVVLMIPCVNLVMMFVWAFGEGNENRRNFCRAQLILTLVGVALIVLFLIIFIGIVGTAGLSGYFNY